MTVAVSAVSAFHLWWSGKTDDNASTWSFFISLWVSSAILSFAIEPITLGVLAGDEWRHATMLQLRDWMRTVKIAVTNAILTSAVYWPIAATNWLLAKGWLDVATGGDCPRSGRQH